MPPARACASGWLGIALLAATPAVGHDWYPEACCARDNDCHPVPCAELTLAPDGHWTWRGYLFPKTHTLPGNILMPSVGVSQDGSCHVCVHGSVPMCVFLPNKVSLLPKRHAPGNSTGG